MVCAAQLYDCSESTFACRFGVSHGIVASRYRGYIYGDSPHDAPDRSPLCVVETGWSSHSIGQRPTSVKLNPFRPLAPHLGMVQSYVLLQVRREVRFLSTGLCHVPCVLHYAS